MNEFKQSLERLLAGAADLQSVDHALNESLSRQPNLAAAHGAIVEAMYRSNRISGEIYLVLIRTIHSFQLTQTQSRAAAKAKILEGDKTVIRVAAPFGVSAPTATAGAAAKQNPVQTQEPDNSAAAQDESDKTRLRPLPSLPSTFTSPTGTTGASWSDAGRWTATASTGVPLGPGSVIKERFVLEEQIGRGGMGTVFKARDLRKEEAQDRNPYVAIKILNEEFKRHPQSLQALQREARKAQKLAHPNIVTVYDFDRDAANVYMVMELLEGESLDRLIKRSEGSGLVAKEALRITRDLCRAMAYAHEQGIVHADFKPANAFRTKEGTVKVFDFGIARAVKLGDQEGVAHTVFDPGTLGALTPAYASTEVIDGADPEAADDVYAIACVAYELLTGRHPYNRMAPNQARAANVLLTPVPGLSRRQWRVLQRSLEAPRDQRPATAMKFLEAMFPLRSSPAIYFGAVAAGVAVLILGIMIAVNQFAKYRERSITDVLAAADAGRVQAVLPNLFALAPAERAAVLSNGPARAGLISYFETRINDAVNSSKGHYEYPKAESLLSDLKKLFPDSQAVRDIEERLVARKSDEIKQQSDRLDASLERGAMIGAQGTPNVQTVLGIVRQIDPRSVMLTDLRLPGAFAKEAQAALDRNDATLAGSLVEGGLAFDAKDAALTDLRDQVRQAVNASRFAERKSQLETSLQRLLEPNATLDDFARQRAPFSELRSIDARSATVTNAQAVAQRLLDQQTAAFVAQGEPGKAREVLSRYADMVSPAFVDSKRQALTAIENGSDADAATPVAGQPTQVGELASADVVPNLSDEELRRQLGIGLEQVRISIADAQSLDAIADELIRRGDTEAEEGKKKLKLHLAGDIKAIRAKRGVDAALRFAESAYGLFPESPVLRKTLIDLKVAAAERAVEKRDASVVEVKTRIDALLASQRIDGEWSATIERQFRRLAAFLPDSDPYVAQSKARAAALYTGRASAFREARRLSEAGAALERARSDYPQSQEVAAEERLLKDARERQAQDVKDRDRVAAYTAMKQKLLVQAQANDVVEAQSTLQTLYGSLPADDPFLTTEGRVVIAQAYMRIASNAAKEGRFKNAVSLVDKGREIAPFLKEMAPVRQRYARYQTIDEHLTKRPRIEARSVRSELLALAKQDPTEAELVAQRLAVDLAERIRNTQDAELVNRLSNAAREIFGEANFAAIAAGATAAQGQPPSRY